MPVGARKSGSHYSWWLGIVVTCKREEKVDDGYQMSKGRGLSKWEAAACLNIFWERWDKSQ